MPILPHSAASHKEVVIVPASAFALANPQQVAWIESEGLFADLCSNCLGIGRISDPKQSAGFSLGDQKTAITAFAVDYGCNLNGYAMFQVRARRKPSGEVKATILTAAAAGQTLIVRSADRLTRLDLDSFAECLPPGQTLHVIDLGYDHSEVIKAGIAHSKHTVCGVVN